MYTLPASLQFFEDESEEILNQFNEKEEELRRFQAEYKLTSLLDQKQALLGRLATARGALSEARVQIKASEARVAALESLLEGRPSTIEIGRSEVDNPANATLKSRLLELRVQEKDLAALYTEEYRDLQMVREQIAVLEAALENEPESKTQITRGVDTARQALESQLETERIELSAAQASEIALAEQLDTLEQDLSHLSLHEAAATRLEREVQQLEDDYWKYRDGLQRAQISAALDQLKVSNVSVVQPATMPMEPVDPRRTRNIALALFMACVASMGMAFLMEYLDDTMKTPEDAEKLLHLPVLATVSDEEFKACI